MLMAQHMSTKQMRITMLKLVVRMNGLRKNELADTQGTSTTPTSSGSVGKTIEKSQTTT